MTQNLSSSAFSALRWNYLGLMTRSMSSFVIGIILARLLGPKPFGQVAAALLVFGLANQIADAGFSAALVHAPELSNKQIRVAFTMQVLIASGISIVTFAIAPWVAVAFHDTAIKPVLRAISPLFIVQSFGQTSTGLLKRRLAFREIQTAQVSSYLLGYLCIGIPAAYLGAGVYSLIAAQLAQGICYSAQVYFRVRHSVIPCLHRSGAELAKYGGKVTGTNLVNWGISNLDNATVGAAFGSVALGLYSRAFNLASFVGDGVVTTSQQVLFSAYSRAQDKLDALQRTYLASVGFIALFLFPAFWGMAISASTVMVGLYGDKWKGAVPLLVPLALAMPIHAIMALSGPLLWARNRVQDELRAQIATLVLGVFALLLSSRYSVVALSWAVLGIYCLRCWMITRKTVVMLNLRWSKLFRTVRGAMALGGITSLFIWVTRRFIDQRGMAPTYGLASLVIIGASIFIAALMIRADRILPRELVDLGSSLSQQMPRRVTTFILRVARRQAPPLRQVTAD